MKITTLDSERVKALMDEGKTSEAIDILKTYIEGEPKSDTAFFLLGNAYRKQENWEEALNNYAKAMELNNESPAKLAYDAIIEVLDFYNHDMYNQ